MSLAANIVFPEHFLFCYFFDFIGLSEKTEPKDMRICSTYLIF